MSWITVKEYSKKLSLKSPQVVYNWIAKNKLKKDIDWRKVKKVIEKIEVFYKD